MNAARIIQILCIVTGSAATGCLMDEYPEVASETEALHGTWNAIDYPGCTWDPAKLDAARDALITKVQSDGFKRALSRQVFDHDLYSGASSCGQPASGTMQGPLDASGNVTWSYGHSGYRGHVHWNQQLQNNGASGWPALEPGTGARAFAAAFDSHDTAAEILYSLSNTESDVNVNCTSGAGGLAGTISNLVNRVSRSDNEIFGLAELVGNSNLVDGQIYYMRVHGFDDRDINTFEFDVKLRTATDLGTSAFPIYHQDAGWGTLDVPSMDKGSCVSSSNVGGPEAVYRLQVPGDAYYKIRTAGSQYDTVLYVRDHDGAELGCNDDVDGTRQSEVVVWLEAYEEYTVFVDGYYPGSQGAGSIQLSVEYN